uniref:DNA repair protein REV1 n=1 Tax=Strongyloides papillosus TaxID=174720 RepID=A0A0N5B347_STREA
MSLEGTILIDDSDDEGDTNKITTKQTIMEQWNSYMEDKIEKLNKQNQILKYGKSIESDIFKGLAICINGRTEPTFIELKEMFIRNGGEFHNYYLNGKTTCIVSTNITANKLKNLNGSEYYVHPNWVVDSVNQKVLKDFKDYLIIRNQRHNFPDARNPNFIENYYGKSRLHLISTMAQEAVKWVRFQREYEYKHDFCNRRLLGKISFDDNYVGRRKVICHIDMDCFFVSVGLINQPELVGQPVAVTHSRSEKNIHMGYSEIASCSYEARKCGLTNGMLIKDAMKLCPNLVKIPYNFEQYKTVSRIFYETIGGFTLDIKAISCDEMYVDFSDLCDTLRIANVEELIKIVRNTVYEETKCRCSIGCGKNMLLARLATKRAKPNGQYIVENVSRFMSQVEVSDLPGIGRKVTQRLGRTLGNVSTCKLLLKENKDTFINAIGRANGEKLFNHIRGIDDRNVLDLSERKSVSCDINYGIRFTTSDDLYDFFKQLSFELEKKLLSINKSCSHITLKLMIRDPSAPVEPSKYLGHGLCNNVSKSIHSGHPVSTENVIFKKLIKCFNFIKPVISDIRGIAVHLSGLSDGKHSTDRTIYDFFSTGSKNTKIDSSRNLDQNVTTGTQILSSDTSESEMSDSLEEEFEEPLSPKLLKTYEENVFSSAFITDTVTVDQKRKLNRIFITYITNGCINKVKHRFEEMRKKTENNSLWLPVIQSLKKTCNSFSEEVYGAYILS